MRGTRTLYSKRWQHFWRSKANGLALVIDVLFVLAGLFILLAGKPEDRLMALFCIAFFGLGAVAMAFAVRDTWPRLELGPLGFSGRVSGQDRFLYWEEVSAFRLERGRVRFAVTPCIGGQRSPWDDPWLDGPHLLELSEGYGQRPEALCALLNTWRERHLGGPP